MPELLDIDVVEPDPDATAAHVCAECEKSFKTKAGLATHRSIVHDVPGEGAKKKKSATPRQPRAKEPGVREQVTGFYQLIADVWSIRDPVCADALRQSAPQAAAMWADLAKRHDWVAKFWSDLGGAAGWPGLLVAHMPLLMAISAHHIQPALEARRQATQLNLEDVDFGPNGAGAFAEAPAG